MVTTVPNGHSPDLSPHQGIITLKEEDISPEGLKPGKEHTANTKH